MLELFDLAESLDIVVEYAPLRTRDGEYRDDLRRIRLREGMTERLTRWTLAHELGHAHLGNQLLIFGLSDPRQESAADEWAALHLIELEQYRQAERLHGGHAPAMAHDLGIVTRGIHAYQCTLVRLGDTVYVKPRYGVGQYTARLTA